MYSDESNSIKSSEQTLEELLYSLYPEVDDEKTQAYSFPFHFFQDILSKSLLSSGFEFFLRTLFYLVFDFFIVFSPPRVPWFETFFPDREPLGYSYVSSKIATQVSSSLIIILVFNMLVIQYIHFITYDPVQHLSEKSATFLHITFYYIPPILSLLLGFLFGCLLLLNSQADLSTTYCTVLSVMVSLVFILLMVSYLVYCTFTKYSMILRRGLFSAWEPPYNIISLVIFFIITAAFPFLSSSFRKSCTLFSVITLIWSLSTIYIRLRPVYLSSIAYFVEIKVVFDGVFFSVFDLISIWVDVRLRYTVIIMQILFFSSFFVSAIMSSSSFLFLRSSIFEDENINQESFPTSNSCIMAIRVSLSFSSKTCLQPHFLKWMLKNRFSADIIPDIVRLNFVLKTNLSDYQIPAVSFSPIELLSLKFLAFQVRQYDKFIISSPNHPSIAYAIEEAQRLFQIVNNVSNDFWTNRDYEQLSIAEYGKRIYRISSFIQNSAISYPHSVDIQNMYVDYCQTIIRTPSKTIIKHVHEFTNIESPGNTIYLFLNQELPEKFDTRNQKRIDSTTEHFISTFVNAAFNPIKRFYLIVPILIFLVGVLFASLFTLRSSKAFDMFSDNVKLLTLSLSMCLDSLNSADSLVQLPSINFISQTLHISLDAASMFRNDIGIHIPIYENIISYMSLFDPFDFDINYTFCPKFTLGLMIIFDFPESNENLHTCHLLWTAAYTSQINEIAEKKYENFVPFFAGKNEKKSNILQGSVVIAIGVIFIIVFIVITLRQRKRIKKLILVIENIVAMNNEICERGEPYIGFSWFIYTILIVLLVLILFLYFLIYIIPIERLENQMVEYANQTLLVANVCRCSTLIMASSIIEVGIKQQLQDTSNTTAVATSSLNRNMFIRADFNENKTLLNRYIIAIQRCRRMFVASLINAASTLTLNDLDDIFKSYIKWVPDATDYDLTNSFLESRMNTTKKYKLPSLNESDLIRFRYDDFLNSISKKKSKTKVPKVISKHESTKQSNFNRNHKNIRNNNNNIDSDKNIRVINDYVNKVKAFISDKDIGIINNDFKSSTKKNTIINDEKFVSTKTKSPRDDKDDDSSFRSYDLGDGVSFTSEIDFQAATLTSLSSIVIDFAELLSDDNLTAESFNFLMARLMFKINISSLLTDSFPEIASLTPIIFKYIDEIAWFYFVLNTLFLIIVSYLLFFQIRCQQKWFYGISVLIRRAMTKYPERLLYIVGVILEDKPKYFDVLPIPIVIYNEKGTIIYANQVVMQYTKHTMDQTIGQPYNEFFTEKSTKYTDLTFSTEKRSFVNFLKKNKKKIKKKTVSRSDDEGEDSLDDLDGENVRVRGEDPSQCFDMVILRDTSKYIELQKTFNDLKDRVTPDLGEIPSRGRLIFIECRFKTEAVKPATVFSKIEAVSAKYNEKKSDKKIESINKYFHFTSLTANDNDNDDMSLYEFFDFKDKNGDVNDRCVTVISCGASYLTAVARIGCEEEAIRFVIDLSSEIFTNFRAAVTEGPATVFGVLEGGSLVVVAGDVAKRATDANVCGLWGRVYVDYGVIERSGIESELKNEELEKVEGKNDSQNNLNTNVAAPLKKFSGLAQNPMAASPAKTLPPRLPSLAALPPRPPADNGPMPASPGARPPAPAPQGGKFGLAKFGLGFGLGKANSAPAMPNLKKSMVVPISPLTKL